MSKINDFDRFKNNIIPLLKGYEINYKFFENGDFGSLNQIEFNSKKIGGNFDFWELGWLGVFLWDYEREKIIYNVLIEPNQDNEREIIFKKLNEIFI